MEQFDLGRHCSETSAPTMEQLNALNKISDFRMINNQIQPTCTAMSGPWAQKHPPPPYDAPFPTPLARRVYALWGGKTEGMSFSSTPFKIDKFPLKNHIRQL